MGVSLKEYFQVKKRKSLLQLSSFQQWDYHVTLFKEEPCLCHTTVHTLQDFTAMFVEAHVVA